MKYRAELIIWAYSDEGESLGCVYESPSRETKPGYKKQEFLTDEAWEEIEETAKNLIAVTKVPRLNWGINDFRNKPVPGTRAMTEKNAIYFFLQKKRIKWWRFQKLFGYCVIGPVLPQHVSYTAEKANEELW